jgi:rubrerythrin
MSIVHDLEALSAALDDEYRARATYRKVIERFGPVRPFVNIVEAEGRHIEALLRQFHRLGVQPPADTWPRRVGTPASLAEACSAGVQAEIENDALYARLFDQVTDRQVRAVMQRLQEASRERHLPAFRRCMQRHAMRSSGTRSAARDAVPNPSE